MKNRFLNRATSAILAFVMLLALVPAQALAATPSVTFQIEANTVDLPMLVEPVTVPLEAGDTVYTILSRVAAENNIDITVQDAGYGNYATKIGDLMQLAHGAESGWMVAINSDFDAWPMPTLKDGDTVRFAYTYKTYGQDIKLLDKIAALDTSITTAELKMAENGGDPFNEGATTPKFDALYAAYEEAADLQTTIEAAQEDGIKKYIDDLGSMVWGDGSVANKIDALIRKLSVVITGADYIKATGATITVEGNPTDFYVGTTYNISATVLPENATDKNFTFEINPIKGDGTITPDGKFTPTKEGMVQIRVNHLDKASGYALANKVVTAKLSPTAVKQQRVEALQKNISKTYETTAFEWNAIDMGAYSRVNETGSALTAATKQELINLAVKKITDPKVTDINLATAVLALKAQGVDPTRLYPVNSATPVNAVALMAELGKSGHTTSAWSAPYIVAAYNQERATPSAAAKPLINLLLAAQKENGSWDEFGTIDTTANVIAGLSFYYNHDPVVKAALDKGIEYLSAKQSANGGFNDGFGENTNSDAMVIVGVSALGINADTDPRFIKNNKSVLDAMLAFALKENTGFGYQNATALDKGATEQAFRALVAYSGVVKETAPFNVYDFSSLAAEPGRATGTGKPIPPTDPEATTNINVSFTLKSNTSTWVSKLPLEIGADATVYNVIKAASAASGFTTVGAENGYVSSVTYKGTTLSEFGMGLNSGWLFKVNDTLPSVGITATTVKEGDHILLYYTTDWTEDPDAGNIPQQGGGAGQATVVLDKDGIAQGRLEGAALTQFLFDAANKENPSIEIKAPAAATGSTLTLSAPVVSALKAGKATSLEIKTSLGTLVLDKTALTSVLGSAGKDGNITLSIKKLKNTESVGALAGKSMFGLEIAGAGTQISTFGGGKISVTLQYELAENESADTMAVYHIDENNKLTKMDNSKYSQNTKSIKFSTTHFSSFAVLPVIVEFADIKADHWAKPSIWYLAQRGIINGKTATEFDPSAGLTRAEAMAILARASGDDMPIAASGFTDVTGKEWHGSYLTWGKITGIAKGVDGAFLPDNLITRQDFAVMIERYLTNRGVKLPQTTTPAAFSDKSEIADYAQGAVDMLARAGIIAGNEGRFSPTTSITRAEAAKILAQTLNAIVK